MSSDQVRQASKLLGPLLRRRGTSPGLGTALRGALQAFDKSLGGLSPQAEDESTAAGIAGLRACVALIEQSNRPADHEQRAGIEQALALLAPLAVAPPPAPALVVPETAAPSTRPAEQRRRRRPRSLPPGLELGSVGALLMGIAARLEVLQVTLDEPLSRLRDVHAAAAELRRQIEAVMWLGRERAPAICRAADVARGTTDRLVAGAALAMSGDAGGGEMLLGELGKAVAAGQVLPAVSATLLGSIGTPGFVDWLRQVFLQPTHPAIAGLLLPLLVERDRIDGEQVWRLANHAKDDVAVPAAFALPWTCGPADLPLLLAWVAAARTQRRAHALLFAAAALGSTAALDEVRSRLRKADAAAEPALIDALAVAGSAEDAALLTELAASTEGDPAYALLAAAHLGSSQTLAVATSLSDRVPAEVLVEVGRMIHGRGSATAGDGANDGQTLDPGVRYLRGQPWTVAGVLAALAASDETLFAHRLMALELRARTGQLPPSRLAALLPSDERSERLAAWGACYTKANGRLTPGRWCHAGR